MDECKHEKTVNEQRGRVTMPPINMIWQPVIQRCVECNQTREKEFISIRLPGFTCFTETVGEWKSEVANLQREMPL